LVTVSVRAIPPPTVVVAPAVAAVTAMSASTQSALADGLGLGDGLAESLADGAADADASNVGSPSGEADMLSPKLGDALGAVAEGSSFDPKAAWSSHQPSHRTTRRPTMTAARRRQ
jgi:hypothetical protein